MSYYRSRALFTLAERTFSSYTFIENKYRNSLSVSSDLSSADAVFEKYRTTSRTAFKFKYCYHYFLFFLHRISVCRLKRIDISESSVTKPFSIVYWLFYAKINNELTVGEHVKQGQRIRETKKDRETPVHTDMAIEHRLPFPYERFLIFLTLVSFRFKKKKIKKKPAWLCIHSSATGTAFQSITFLVRTIDGKNIKKNLRRIDISVITIYETVSSSLRPRRISVRLAAVRRRPLLYTRNYRVRYYIIVTFVHVLFNTHVILKIDPKRV